MQETYDLQRADTPPIFTRWQRCLIGLASYVGYVLIYVIGRTLRWTVRGWEHWQTLEKTGVPAIMVCWHNTLFPAIWFWRRRGIIAMVSQSFEGEYIARIIEMLGYSAARGSSSHRGKHALREMELGLNQGCPVVFTTDGPRGPRYVAKIGSVLLAQRTGQPILCFHVSLKRQIALRSWDAFKIPIPFTPALIQLAPPLYVPGAARRAQILATHTAMQSVLDRLREQGERFWQDPGAGTTSPL